MAIPLRSNGDRIRASWFNTIKTEVEAIASGTDSVISFALTDGMSATDITGATYDGGDFSSVIIEFEATRSTTHFEVGKLALRYKNSTWSVSKGESLGDLAGLTFSVSQVGDVAQLRVATSSGPGTGNIKLRSRRFAV
jgi:hypothetical protein